VRIASQNPPPIKITAAIPIITHCVTLFVSIR
jgi:hypothetical protein